jgi:ATP-dependent Lon protease
VRSQVHKNQKEFYLNEQLKAIRKELGPPERVRERDRRTARRDPAARMPQEVASRRSKELDRSAR